MVLCVIKCKKSINYLEKNLHIKIEELNKRRIDLPHFKVAVEKSFEGHEKYI